MITENNELRKVQAIDLPYASCAFDVLLGQYTGLHYVDFETDEVVSYMISERIQDTGEMMKKKVHFSVMWNQFVEFAVHDDDKEAMRRFCDVDYLADIMADTDVVKHIFRRGYAEGYLYTMMKVVVVDRVDDAPRRVVVMFEEADDEISATFHVEQAERNYVIQKRITEGLAMLVESRDLNTGAHIQRTGSLYSMIVDRLRECECYPELKDDVFCDDIKYGSILHDIGKIYVSDVILNKPARLTPEEFEIIKTHTTLGANIVDELFSENIEKRTADALKDIVLYHHERWDGTGYPEKLSGEDIPIAARIMAVTDVFDALISKRPYKDEMSVDEAYSIIEAQAGSHFDEKIVKAFCDIRPEVENYVESSRGFASNMLDVFSEQIIDSARRVAVVNNLVDEFESIYLVDINNDILYVNKASDVQPENGRVMSFSHMADTVLGSISEDDIPFLRNLGNIGYLKGYLHDENRREFIFHMADDNELRRCIIQVTQRIDGEPSEAIFSFMKVDDERAENIRLTEELERNYEMLECLASEYLAVYFVDLDKDKFIPYRMNRGVERILVGDHESDTEYSISLQRYAQDCVMQGYRDLVNTVSKIYFIKEELSHQKSFSRIYMNDREEYREIKYVKVGGIHDEPKMVALAFTDVDESYRTKLAAEALKEQVKNCTGNDL